MTLVFTGGGTGGHLVIALSLAQEAKVHGHKVIFIGSTNGQDRQWFGESSVFEETYFLETTGVVNKKGLGKIGALWKIVKAVIASRRIIRTVCADAVVSVGGFSAAPAGRQGPQVRRGAVRGPRSDGSQAGRYRRHA